MKGDSETPVRSSNVEACVSEEEIRGAQIAQLYKHAQVGLIAAVVCAVILAVSLWNEISHFTLVTWLGCYLALQVPRLLLITRFHRSAPVGGEAISWGRWFALLTGFSALMWGLGGLFFFPSHSLQHQFLLALFLCGIAAAAVASYSVVTECYLPAVPAALLPLAARHFFEGGEVYITLGIVIAIYAIVLVIAGRRMHAMNSESLRLSLEKTRLIEWLMEEKARADQLNRNLKTEIDQRKGAERSILKSQQDLEERVEERTWDLSEANERLQGQILQRKKAEEELRKFKTISDQANYGTAMTDLEGNLIYANEAFAKMHGYARDEILGRHWTDLEEDQPENAGEKWLSRLRDEGRLQNEDVWHRRKDAGQFIAFINAMVIRDDDLNPLFYSVTAIDITERIKARQFLQRSARMKAIGEMASGVSHNFNNLLQVVIGGAQISIGNLEDEEYDVIKSNLQRIIQTSGQGAEMVRRLQHFARLGDEKALRTGEVFDFSETADQAIEMTKPYWKSGALTAGIIISIKRSLTPGCMVEGKENELFEVIVNLISNAVDALPDGGRIEVKTSVVNDQVRLQVRDDGVGIASDDIENIFEPFWTTKGMEAMGMGLAASIGIVHQHQGRIKAESTPGEATSFTIDLPPAAKQPDAPKPSDADARAGKARILVVDDMEPVLFMMQHGLKKHVQEVLTAKSGPEALEIFRRESVDVVISDLAMPDMSGWQVSKAIKEICEEEGRPKTPVILVTGWGDQIDEVEKIAEHHVDRMVEKPIDFDSLAKTIGELKRKSR
ncbi:ATP-binding protein [Thermodesulfobacteriota bacterium]